MARDGNKKDPGEIYGNINRREEVETGKRMRGSWINDQGCRRAVLKLRKESENIPFGPDFPALCIHIIPLIFYCQDPKTIYCC